MATEEFEPVPHERSPIKHYYSDMFHKKEMYVDLVIAAERLLVEAGICDDAETCDRFYGSALPTGSEYEQNEQAAYDKLLVMPLRLIAPSRDESLDLPELEEWYNETIAFIIKYTKGHHSIKCLNDSRISEENHFCPLVYTTEYLTSAAKFPDFSEFMYIVDPEKQRRIALYKMQVAKKYNLEFENLGNVAISRYIRSYNMWFDIQEIGTA